MDLHSTGVISDLYEAANLDMGLKQGKFKLLRRCGSAVVVTAEINHKSTEIGPQDALEHERP